MSIVNKILQFNFFRTVIFKIETWRASFRVKQIHQIIFKGGGKHFNSILDIGCGSGAITEQLLKNYKNVIGFDIANHNLSDSIKFVLGLKNEPLPFTEKEFDCSLLIFVLHHTEKPENILKEAYRVSRNVIIFEDLITNPLQRYYTYFCDSFMNFEWFGHPHSNKSKEEWEKIFKNLKYKEIDKLFTFNIFGLKQGIYFLSK